MKITSLITIIVCIAAYFTYIKPTLSEVGALREQKSRYMDILDKAKEIKTKRDIIMSAYNSISQDDLDRLSKVIPKKFDAVFFGNDLSSMTSKYGLNVIDLKVSQNEATRDVNNSTNENNQYKTYFVTFRVSGSYEQFIKFMKDLESSLELVDVVNLSVKPTSRDSLEYKLDAYTYSLE